MTPRYWFGIAAGVGALGAGVGLMATAAWLIATASEQPPVLTLMVAVVAVRAFGLARPVLRYLERLLTHDAALRVVADARATVYQALIPLTPARLRTRHGHHLTAMAADVDVVMDRWLRSVAPLVTAAAAAVLGVAVLGWLDPVAGVWAAGCLAVGGCAAWWCVRAGAAMTARRIDAEARLTDATIAALRSAPERTIAGTVDGLREELVAAIAGVQADADRATGRTAAGHGVAQLAAAAALVGSAWFAGASSQPSVGVAAVLVLAPLAFFELAATVPVAAAAGAVASARQRRLDALTSQPPAVAPTDTSEELPQLAPSFELVDVTAGWDARDVLRGVTMMFPAGEVTALTGPSGIGKSTLVAVLLRWIDVRAGTCKISDIRQQDVEPDELYRLVGYVGSDTHIFGNTLAANLRLAAPDAADADLAAAARRAGLDLPLDTWLGDGGARLSGGERQRVALARLLLRKPRAVILDEPTAHLDGPAARSLLADALSALRGATIVLITHDLAQAALADHHRELTGTIDSDARLVNDGHRELTEC